jgi:hypothetical protein
MLEYGESWKKVLYMRMWSQLVVSQLADLSKTTPKCRYRPVQRTKGFFLWHLYSRGSPYGVILYIYKKKESSQGIYIRGEREERGGPRVFTRNPRRTEISHSDAFKKIWCQGCHRRWPSTTADSQGADDSGRQHSPGSRRHRLCRRWPSAQGRRARQPSA